MLNIFTFENLNIIDNLSLVNYKTATINIKS